MYYNTILCSDFGRKRRNEKTGIGDYGGRNGKPLRRLETD